MPREKNRGMYKDGSRWFIDSRGIKWNISKVKIIDNNFKFYVGQSVNSESCRDILLRNLFKTIENDYALANVR